MKFYGLTNRAYHKYRTRVKNNNEITYLEAKKKLNRNIKLAFVAPKEDEESQNKQLYLYGNLSILVVDDKIVHVGNHSIPTDWFYKDEAKYERLNQELGIKADIV